MTTQSLQTVLKFISWDGLENAAVNFSNFLTSLHKDRSNFLKKDEVLLLLYALDEKLGAQRGLRTDFFNKVQHELTQDPQTPVEIATPPLTAPYPPATKDPISSPVVVFERKEW